MRLAAADKHKLFFGRMSNLWKTLNVQAECHRHGIRKVCVCRCILRRGCLPPDEHVGHCATSTLIASIQGNGTLTWSDPGFESNSLHRIEWAPALSGPWARDWAGLQMLEMTNATGPPRFPCFTGSPAKPIRRILPEAGDWQDVPLGVRRADLLQQRILYHWATNSPDAQVSKGSSLAPTPTTPAPTRSASTRRATKMAPPDSTTPLARRAK